LRNPFKRKESKKKCPDPADYFESFTDHLIKHEIEYAGYLQLQPGDATLENGILLYREKKQKPNDDEKDKVKDSNENQR